ncbi:hypothetical protein Afer_1689 [Acidimicrobium ferrooxidans DSM 10331]|uniref:Lipoprotein n=1 Tax=Acidimicrobium ferrooxidans (strain DSM 10331 / JCM 15462 / NBRC 103882 / ICP) TaxID=525909 RepID=C7M0U7_ACIFD|nr:hypothetical protein [Acidimicrobium ferrooxidans]ACU54605.1 hypothetical protein Afer_1689 [Acidimicrobium ferrooxidans DSM 10331]
MRWTRGRGARVAVVASLGALLAACATATSAATQAPPAPENFAAIVARPSGGELIEVQSYQHGQVLVQQGNSLSLATPLGVSTRAGIVLASGGSAGLPVYAGEVAHGTWPYSVLWSADSAGWTPQEFTTAVAPFPGSVVATTGGGEAIVGTRSFGLGDQSIVDLAPNGTIATTLVSSASLAALEHQVGCVSPVARSLAPDGETLVVSCGSSARLAVVDLAARTARTVALAGHVVATSAVVDGATGPLVAVIVATNDRERLQLVDLVGDRVVATVSLGSDASLGPSLAASGTRAVALVPHGARATLVEFEPVTSSGGVITRAIAAPAWAQGVGVTSGGAVEVVAGNPNLTGVGLLQLDQGSWREIASATTPTVNQG